MTSSIQMQLDGLKHWGKVQESVNWLHEATQVNNSDPGPKLTNLAMAPGAKRRFSTGEGERGERRGCYVPKKDYFRLLLKALLPRVADPDGLTLKRFYITLN